MLDGSPHPPPPALPVRETPASAKWALFWSLPFAVDAPTWRAAGPVPRGVTGYGAGDTDFRLAADRAGVHLRWIRGADVHHRHHGSESPPVRPRDDILRDAAVSTGRWGSWPTPTQGWLDRFAELRIARCREGRWEPVGPATR